MHKLFFQIFHDSHFLSVAGRRNYIISGMLYIETGPQCYFVTGYILPQRCLPAALLPVFRFSSVLADCYSQSCCLLNICPVGDLACKDVLYVLAGQLANRALIVDYDCNTIHSDDSRG